MEIVLLAILSMLILCKLFLSLGKEDGVKHLNNLKKNHESIDDAKNIGSVELSAGLDKESDIEPNILKILQEIHSQDASFNLDAFLEGAKKAFKMIVLAVNNHDSTVLENLLEKDVYNDFMNEIQRREKKKIHYEVTLVGIKDIKILDATINKSKATIKLRIHSEQIIQVQDKELKTISNSCNSILEIFDTWSFSKEVTSVKTWLLSETLSK